VETVSGLFRRTRKITSRMKTKQEIIKAHYEAKYTSPKYMNSVNRVSNFEYISPAMDEYAKEIAVEFFKWNTSKIVGYIQYIQQIRDLVRSEEIERNLNEFEGATLEERFELFQAQIK
jgi:hypothetical protein